VSLWPEGRKGVKAFCLGDWAPSPLPKMLKILFECKAGELLKKMAETGQRQTRGRPQKLTHDGLIIPPVTLAELEIEDHQATRWQAEAKA